MTTTTVASDIRLGSNNITIGNGNKSEKLTLVGIAFSIIQENPR